MLAFLWVVCSIVVALIAYVRGRSLFGYLLLSLLLSPLITLIILLIIGPNVRRLEEDAIAAGKLRRCAACAELVRSDALKCKHCGSSLQLRQESRIET